MVYGKIAGEGQNPPHNKGGDFMGVRMYARHTANPLHVYCRIMDLLLHIGVPGPVAKKISTGTCEWYEARVFKRFVVKILKINTKGR